MLSISRSFQNLKSSSNVLLIHSKAATFHNNPMIPLWQYSPLWATPAVRRLACTMNYYTNNSTTTRTRIIALLQRYRQNGARLYARHILAAWIAAAAAAAAKRNSTAQCLQASHNIERPMDWHNWERKDWADDLLEKLGRTRFHRAWAATARLFQLGVVWAPLAVLIPLGYVPLVGPKCHTLSWDYALWGIEQAGPTYIKLFQWATTRQDLFSPAFCRHFGQLRDQTRGHAWNETQRILNEDLGEEESIIHIDNPQQPIGSGCIAQVYKGRLKEATDEYPAGTELAVKVQHPGIWHKVCVDFYIMGKVASFLEGLPLLNLRFLSLQDTVRQFRDIMLPQLDLTLEAKHLQRFNRDFADDPHVHFPQPLDSLTTSRVLTETFLEGKPILEYCSDKQSNNNEHDDATEAEDAAKRKELAYLGLSTTLKMIFLHDFLHGDLHAGNIVVSEEPNGHVNLNLLDCGLVVEMGPEQHVNLTKILAAFTRRDGRLGGQLMVDSSSDCQASEWDIEQFVSGIHRIIQQDENNNFVENVGDYIADICYMACKHKVKLEASFINAALAVEIVEGIAQSLYPEIIVTKEALPLIIKAEMMHQLRSIW